ncbi:MAG: MBL fold metallo-hydrolase [Eubacteriales bacterium]
MKLTVLVDNNSIIDRYFLAEPGFCYYIEEGEVKLLFDVGYSRIFIDNAQKMNVDLNHLNYVVFSHGHLDHTGGLDPLMQYYLERGFEGTSDFVKPMVLAHPDCFKPKYIKGIGEIGSRVSEKMVARNFKMVLSKDPYWLTEKLVFLGEIERVNDFENRIPIGKMIEDDKEKDDYVLDDSALVYKTEEGLVIITGCSHSGICNIIEKAKNVCSDERIVDIIGGFHLLSPEKNVMDQTLEYIENARPEIIHACHCTDLKSKILLSKIAELEEVGVGLKLVY